MWNSGSKHSRSGAHLEGNCIRLVMLTAHFVGNLILSTTRCEFLLHESTIHYWWEK